VPYSAESAIITYCKLQASLKDAYGEGANRIARYERDWQKAIEDLRKQVGNFAQHEVISLGGAGLRRGGRGFGSRSLYDRSRRVPEAS
jgi:hypothetical protein